MHCKQWNWKCHHKERDVDCETYGSDNAAGACKLMMVNFLDKPEIDASPTLLKFASDAGDTGKLICRSQASPLARFTWSKNGSPISVNTSGKYYSAYHQVSLN